jgi:tyrosine-specific transport protein
MKSLYQNKTLGGILLVAGTSIGAGMLALPITTGIGGFYSAIGLFLLCFLYMLMTLFLLLEANLYEPSLDANIITMSRRRLGVLGQIVSWVSFLLLYYAVAAAYMSAGGSLIGKLMTAGNELSMTRTNITIVGFAAICGLLVFFGAWLVDHVNRFMMFGLIATYFILVFFVTPHVQVAHLNVGESKYLLAAVPVIILSFTSHVIVPSLRMYMQNNLSQLKKSLLLGSLVPLVFYVVWEFIIVGVLPATGEYSLGAIASRPHPVAGLTQALYSFLGLSWIAAAVGAFSFFALVTSFLAVILGLIDFLSDGFQIKKNIRGRIILLLLTLVPPLIFALYFPSGFVAAISYGGVFVAILYGILPPLMIWKARYHENLDSGFKVAGGKPVLIFTLIGAVMVILFQVASTLNLLPTP